MITTRRRAASLLGFLALGLSLGAGALAQSAPKELRIGYQKVGLVVVARQQGLIEKQLASQGVAVRWVEFQAGPPLLEALNAGGIDFGYTGDAPPIFSQAAGGNLVYVGAAAPTRDGEAILVKATSPIRSVADLKGKTVAVGRGTSSHNLLIAALEKAGLSFSDIKPAYLLPSDAGSAFANDSVDAWVIWDPYLALAQSRGETRVLATTGQTHDVSSFFLANRTFAEKNPGLIAGALSGLTEAAGWARTHRDEVAQSLAAVTGVPYPVQKVAADRTEFAVRPLSDEILTAQQTTADRFFRLGLIPRPIKVRDIVWSPPRT
ncbi:sulfonate ABC transporter substrate-binding protein [Methylobacterium aerolatum]|uniref:Sulfonate transport system substrate-binding protein n=1 Tax=Methylobacterium aerolatum TaxID=418708 RepID=A0ABU0I5I5_9HYPH|nr:sulfonate ABC transporter substrate-binding protein [Methylobacterium aerolatum]MDQ0449140.1 sulfonate transport system substrate-binding protein [Methylobacterium aerolatum]GJD35328.1 Putative aliphatic sulfonates-binding protein [Methylobacterium aerolatum]